MSAACRHKRTEYRAVYAILGILWRDWIECLDCGAEYDMDRGKWRKP